MSKKTKNTSESDESTIWASPWTAASHWASSSVRNWGKSKQCVDEAVNQLKKVDVKGVYYITSASSIRLYSSIEHATKKRKRLSEASWSLLLIYMSKHTVLASFIQLFWKVLEQVLAVFFSDFLGDQRPLSSEFGDVITGFVLWLIFLLAESPEQLNRTVLWSILTVIGLRNELDLLLVQFGLE